MNSDKLFYLTNKMNDVIYKSSGSNKYSSMIHFLSGIISRNSIYNPAITDNGYIFFGKPKLNLQSSSLKQDRILAVLNTLSSDSLAFALRCYLDPIFANRSDIVKMAENCLLYQTKAPYIPVLTNTIETLTGWPEPTMEIETTEGGFFSENITTAKGHNDLNKTITLSAVFNEFSGFPITNLFMMWFRWIHLSLRGVVKPYNKYIEEYKISYTMPIYRFRLDSSGKYIIFWAKGTGCFPTTYPIANIMEFNKKESKKFHNKCNVSITVNFVEYMDIAILQEFNVWIKRACKDIENYKILSTENFSISDFLAYQSLAIPYIDFTNGKKELQWKIDPDIYNTLQPINKKLDNITTEIYNLLRGKLKNDN